MKNSLFVILLLAYEVGQLLLCPVLKLAKTRLEVDTYSEDASGINQRPPA